MGRELQAEETPSAKVYRWKRAERRSVWLGSKKGGGKVMRFWRGTQHHIMQDPEDHSKERT